MVLDRLLPVFCAVGICMAQPSPEKAQALAAVQDNSEAPQPYRVETGTRIPLVMINSVSTKHAAEGDRVYLETSFPVLAGGRVVIPPGSYVAGTITSAKRAGRVKGRAELYLRFDSLTLPNGATRDFRARLGALDGRSADEFDRSEGRIKGESTKGDDARKVGEAAGGGASIGVIAGSIAGRPGMGAGVGAAAGAAAGMVGVLLSRGQDVVLGRGTVVEMVLDRTLVFQVDELDFQGTGSSRRVPLDGESGPLPRSSGGPAIPSRRPGLGIP